MKRRHLFEWSDLPGWPDALRRLLTDYLQAFHDVVQPFTPLVDTLARAMQATGTDRVVDLCAGTGGPWARLAPEVARVLGRPITVLLTDKFPSPQVAVDLRDHAYLRYCSESVDATAVPADMNGLRTLIGSFHHFRPAQAQAILQDAVDRRAPIAILETLERSPGQLAGMVWTPLVVSVLTPRIRPRSLLRLALTYAIPLAPVLITWDATVSTLRSYTPDEMLAMTRALRGPRYHWEVGTYQRRATPVTYLIGYPADAAGAPAG